MIRTFLCFALFTFGLAFNPERISANVNSHQSASEWFEVESYQNGPSASQVLALCEDLRSELFRVWGGNVIMSKWEPRCKIRLHPTRVSYVRKVGSNSGQTSGCSQIQLQSGKIVCREIDLLINLAGELPALPHELTHVVLADIFRGKQPPHWLDEGIAMLADTTTKQNLHYRDCNEAIMSGRAIPIRQLVTLESFSSPQQMPAFYGQSLLLVRMLTERDSPHKVIEFANDSLNQGMEAALKQHYAIDSIDHLEKAWRAYMFQPPTTKTRGSVVMVKFKP